MKNSIFIVLIAIGAVAISLSVHAEGKITGAFGIELGQTFNPKEAIDKGLLTDGTPRYQFNPKKKFRSFSTYFVLITPKSHQVYSIRGIGNMENDSTCKKEQALIMDILQKKYGNVEKDQLFSSLYDIKLINQVNRHVLTSCSGFVDTHLYIYYKDKKLEKQAEKERIILESEKIDSSGL